MLDSSRSAEFGYATSPRSLRPSGRSLRWIPYVLALGAFGVGLVQLVRASGLVPHGYVAGDRAPSPRDRMPSGPKAPQGVLASKLWADYHSDEKLANAHYKGETLDVVGRVTGMDSDLVGSLIVQIESPNPFAPTRAYLADTSAPPVKGTDVTLRCKGGGVLLGSPVLRDCEVR